MSRPRKLTEADEDAILHATNARKMLSEKVLAYRYRVSRKALSDAIARARKRHLLTKD